MGEMYKKALETGICFHRGPIGGTWSRDSYSRDFERKVSFCSYLEPLFIWDSKKCEKEDFDGGRHLALRRGPLRGTWRGGEGAHSLGTSKRQAKEDCGNGPPPPK